MCLLHLRKLADWLPYELFACFFFTKALLILSQSVCIRNYFCN